MTKEEALRIAEAHNLENDVKWCIETCGYIPEDALALCGLTSYYQTVQRTIYEDSKYIEVLLLIVSILVMLSN